VAASCGSCRERSSAAPADASVDVVVKTLELPWRGTVVARFLGREAPSLDRVNDGVLLRTGLFLYRFKPDGALEPIGSPEAYRAFLPEEDHELAGYDARPRSLASADLTGDLAHPFVHLPDQPNQAFGWDGPSWRAQSSSAAPRPY